MALTWWPLAELMNGTMLVWLGIDDTSGLTTHLRGTNLIPDGATLLHVTVTDASNTWLFQFAPGDVDLVLLYGGAGLNPDNPVMRTTVVPVPVL